MDATSADALPHGVADTRIPRWVLPKVPPHLRLKLRPDLLIFAGLRSSDPRLPPLRDPTALATDLGALQHRVTVHIIELTYTSHDSEALQHKEFVFVLPRPSSEPV
jgi:hypothetical protein